MAYDSLGYLWVANSYGLDRYNGKIVESYKKSIPSRDDFLMNAQKIFADNDGGLWHINGAGNIFKFNYKTEDFDSVPNITRGKSFTYHNNNLFIGTIGQGIYKIDVQTKDTLNLNQHTDKYTSVHRLTKKGNYVYASTSSGVLRIDENNNIFKYTNFPAPDSLITSITASTKQAPFVGTYMNGIYQLDEKSQEFTLFTGFKDYPFTKDKYITDLFLDSKNRMWISVYGDGLYLADFNSNTIQFYQSQKFNDQSIAYNGVTKVEEDKFGTIWVCTEKGLNFYDPYLYKFSSLTNNDLPYEHEISIPKAMDMDKEGNLWIGTHNTGIFKINAKDGEIEMFNTQNSGITSNRILSLAFVEEDLWISNEQSEINIMSPNGIVRNLSKRSNPSLEFDLIYDIIYDSEKNIWLRTHSRGLLKIRPEDIVNSTSNLEPMLIFKPRNTAIRYLLEDNKKRLWICTNKVLYSIDVQSGIITDYVENAFNINLLCTDPEYNFLWAYSAGHGLFKFFPETAELEKIEFPAERELKIFNMKSTEENLWFGTNQGIVSFNKSTGTTISFNDSETLQSNLFEGADYLDRDSNTMYFSGENGVNWFKPSDLIANPHEPETVIYRLELFSDEIPLEQNLEFKHDSNTLTFSFSSLRFTQSAQSKFQYKLEGLENEYIPAGTDNNVRYSKLPPGDYEFKVISSSYDNVWDQTPATYQFTILNPWYNTALAKVSYILLALLIVYSIYYYLRSRWILQTQVALEKKEKERFKELDEIKNRLYTNLSHEFRTPLSLIIGPIENYLKNPSVDIKKAKDLYLVKNNANRLLNLVDQMLDLSKIETGNIKVSARQISIEPLIKQIVSVFEYEANEKHIDFNVRIGKLGKGYLDAEVTKKILFNLLGNALKYTPENGQINFTASKTDDKLLISVKNNGANLTQSEVDKLFERYYQKESTSVGAGIGLALVKELTNMAHGRIHVDLENDIIEFKVALPVSRVAYSEDEIIDLPFDFEKPDDDINIKNSSAIITFEENIVLIVEDDKELRNFISSIFNKDYKVKSATNGLEGLELAKKHVPDIIISDVMMPEMDGMRMVKAIRQNEITSHIPIILLTAKSGEQNELSGLKLGAEDYILKPFSPDKLLYKVENLLNLRHKLQVKYSTGFNLNNVNIGSVDHDFMKNLQDVLSENISNPNFKIEDLSSKMFMSRMQLHRKIKALTGKSTTEFVRIERCKLAAKLLTTTNYTVTEIGFKVGFNSKSYFTRSFTNFYKKSPSEYRKSS